MSRYPSLFQVNTRVRLSELTAELGRPATLDDIPDAELDRLAADGFDIVWMGLAFGLDVFTMVGGGYKNRNQYTGAS